MAQHDDEEEEEKMLKMNTSLEGKAGLNLQKQKAMKTHIKIWNSNQPTGGRQEEISAKNDDDDDASSDGTEEEKLAQDEVESTLRCWQLGCLWRK